LAGHWTARGSWSVPNGIWPSILKVEGWGEFFPSFLCQA